MLKHSIYKTSRKISLMRNLTVSMVNYGTIKTTNSRAKALKIFLEPLVTKGKYYHLATDEAKKLHYRRSIFAKLGHNTAVTKKIIDEISPNYANRSGGYLSLSKLYIRKDSAVITSISWVS